MVPLPVWLSLLALFAACATGWRLASAKTAADPGLSVDNALRRLPGVALLIGATLLSIILAPVIALRAPAWLWYLPFFVQYWFAGLIWTGGAALFALIGALAAGIAWRTAHPQRRQLAGAAPVLLSAMLVPQWSFTRPIADTLNREVERDGTILQSSGSSCVAASGANIARLLGVPRVNEPEVARRMGTTLMGTSMPQAVVAMRELGIECTPADPRRPNPAALDTPAFLFVDNPSTGPEGHAIVLVRTRADGRFELIDPLYGKSVKTRDELDQIWHGLAVGCRRR